MTMTAAPGARRAPTDKTWELSTIIEAVCSCSQTHGRHANTCLTTLLARSRAFGEVLAAHDRRLLTNAEEFCTSCGIALDPDNMLRLNAIPYHLGNCPAPKRTP